MSLPYFDAHCDTLSRCLRTGEGLLRNSGRCDLERLGAYESPGQVFAIFHDSARLSPQALLECCRQQAELFLQAKEAWPERMVQAHLSIEGAELIGCDPARLEKVRCWGVRLINLTWNRSNALSGTHLEEPERGLSDLGRAFVRRCWEVGIFPDVSHLSDPGFWDLAELSQGKRPLVASHSNSRAVCPHTRNLTDQQFIAIRDSGGLVGINLYGAFVGEKRSMEELLTHFDHFLALGGEQTLALGADWDGGTEECGGIRGVEGMYLLAEAMDRRGYSEGLIRAIFHGNLQRLLSAG